MLTRARIRSFALCLISFAAFPDAPAAAQDYFRQLDTRPTVEPEPAAPVYPVLDLGRPSSDVENFPSTAPYQPVNPPSESEYDRYNWAIGPLRFNVAAGVGIEYNDNINLGPSGDEESDFILRPSLTLDAMWRLSEMNTLRFSLGASYAKYFQHSEFDSRSVLLSPSSSIGLTFLVSNVRITVRDRFSYQEDPYDLVVLSNTATYRRFENDAGIQFDWSVNEWVDLTVGYSHYNLWSFESEFDSLTRAVDTIYIRPSVAVSPAVRVGLNGSVSWVNFQESIQNDGTNYFIGPFVEAQLTQNTSIYLEGGYQGFEFDSSGTVPDNANSNSFYVRADVINKLSEAFTHRLSFTKTAEVGFGSNFYDLYHLEYSANWRLTESLTAAPTAFWENYKTSDGEGAFIAEKANRYGLALGLRYVLTPSITLGLDYRFLLNDSNLNGASYHQNLVLLSLFYNF